MKSVGKQTVGKWLLGVTLAGVWSWVAEAPAADSPAKANRQPDTLELLNGDLLHGRFVRFEADGGLGWQHPAIEPLLTVKPAAIAQVRLDRPDVHKREPENATVVRLTNGDELSGTLVSLDDETLVLETWYAGTLKLRRDSVQSVHPGFGGGHIVFTGPLQLKEWTLQNYPSGADQDNPAWTLDKGAFFGVRPGSIGRDLKLPSAVNIQFDLNWQRYLRLYVYLFGEELELNKGSAYVLYLYSNRISLYRYSASGSRATVGGSLTLPTATTGGKLRVNILADRERRTVALMLDGKLVKEWQDTKALEGQGTGLMFGHTSSLASGTTRISNLDVRAWNGRLPSPAGSLAREKDDLVLLLNGDKITGRLNFFKAGALNFKTPFATLDVPIERVTQIVMAKDDREIPPLKAGDVRAWLKDGHRVTLQLERWDETQLSGSSPSFGHQLFQGAAFSRIEFNPDKTRAAQR